MSRRILVPIAFALFACGAAYIAPAVSPQLVDAGKAKWPDATLESLQRGRDTFVASCGKGGFCHGLRDPHAYPADKWPSIVERMAKKADLKDALAIARHINGR